MVLQRLQVGQRQAAGQDKPLLKEGLGTISKKPSKNP
jgi:hypothetical protein